MEMAWLTRGGHFCRCPGLRIYGLLTSVVDIVLDRDYGHFEIDRFVGVVTSSLLRRDIA